jgi:hypothetical protein
MLVGTVFVCNDGDSLTVTYDTSSSGWPITETHLAVGAKVSDIPQTKTGNPIPGQFPYSSYHDPAVTSVTYDIPYTAAVGDPVIIAAHGVVWDPASTGLLQVCSNGDETYTAYNNAVLGPDAGAPDGRTGTAYPSSEPYGEQTDAAASLWDLNVGAPFYTDTGSTGCADWIWENNQQLTPEGVVLNQVVNPINGDRVEFTESFSIPGPFASGTLYASCDNAYEAYVNTATPGSPLISGQTGAGWWDSDLYESYVNTNGWQSVESAPLTGLLQGPNYLFFRAGNEYMNTDDLYNQHPGNTPVSVIGAVPPEFKFVPSAYINPAGLIFQADINYYADDETMWGAQGPGPGANQFPGKNWATYITYTWQ